MLISFQLTMPNVGSWNGKWSGEGNKYYIIKSVSKRFFDKCKHFKTLRELGKDGWYYRWNDGWGAYIIVEVVTAYDAKQRRKISRGFNGYDWMISSIVNYGEILNSEEQKQRNDKGATNDGN